MVRIIKRHDGTRNRAQECSDENIIPMSRITYERKGLINKKRKDIESMFPFMSARDIIYFKTLF